MKKLFLFFSIIATLPGFGQANMYKPFPEVYGTWRIITQTYGSNNVGPTYDTTFYTSGDTLVNAMVYKKVNRVNGGTLQGPAAPINTAYTGGTYTFCYRNDSLNKKVYIIPGNMPQEMLWYDFNLQAGDTIKNMYCVKPYMILVNAIDSILICNKYYRTFSVSCTAPGGAGQGTNQGGFLLMEGAGFSTHFINAFFADNCAFEPYSIASTGAWTPEECPNDWAGIQINNINTAGTKIYPNPANGIVTVEFPHAADNSTLSIKDVVGREVSYQSVHSDRNILIDTDKLPNGIYFVDVKIDNATDRHKLIVQH